MSAVTLASGNASLRQVADPHHADAMEPRRGFSYGTLTALPERGEASFILERRGDGSVLFTVEAVARPVSLLAKLGGPLTRRIQSAATNRYLRVAG